MTKMPKVQKVPKMTKMPKVQKVPKMSKMPKVPKISVSLRSVFIKFIGYFQHEK